MPKRSEEANKQEKPERSSSPSKGGGTASGEDAGQGPQVGTRFSAKEIHENIREQAEEELERPASELVWSSLSSGMLISFSYLAAAFLTSLAPPRLHAVMTAVGYPLGFIFVVLARHQLFTENTLEPVLPVLEERTAEKLWRLLRLWGIVLPLNLVGALLFALVLAHTQVLEPALREPLRNVARTSIEGGFVLVLYKGIWAGWLIALMAWLISSTRDTTAQILLICLTTAPIAAFGFKHSIAGATEAFYLAARGDAGWWQVAAGFEIPAILGNIIGGVVLVALVNHGQSSSGEK